MVINTLLTLLSLFCLTLSARAQENPAPAPAVTPQFLIPAACTPGRDCWIVNHVDTDTATDAFADYKCGRQTYDGHQGTDIAVRDMAAMNAGVDVLAAAGGTVLRARDGIEDRMPGEGEIEKMLAENRGCGNGIVLDHGNGWQTIYCHLKKGSIAVKPDDKITAGQRIAQVGHSGAAQFPHVHFGVFRDTRVIDPFTAQTEGTACGAGPQQTLWLPGLALAYQPVSLYAAGFADSAPDYDSLLQNAANIDALPADTPALVFWAMMYNAAAGDDIALQIRDPGGTVIAERTIAQEDSRARQYYYVGKRNPGVLAPGAYTGTLTLTRTLPGGATVTRSIGRALYVQQSENGTP